MSMLLLIAGLTMLVLLSFLFTSTSPVLVTVVEYVVVCHVFCYKMEKGMSYTKVVYVPPDICCGSRA